MRYPVVRLSFGKGDFTERGYLRTNLMAQFDAIENDSGLEKCYDTGPERFPDLLQAMHRETGHRVSVLVDEYAKPIVDALEVEEVARANRN